MDASSLFNRREMRAKPIKAVLGEQLGSSRALRQVGKRSTDKSECKVILFTTHWHDSKEDSINDAGLCHGGTGFAMIFKYMYDVTGDGCFAPTAQYWSGVTLDLAVYEVGPAGYTVLLWK